MINRLLHNLTSTVSFNDFTFLNETNVDTNKTTLTYVLDETYTDTTVMNYINYLQGNTTLSSVNLIPYILCLLHNLPDIESLIGDDYKDKTYTANSFNLMSITADVYPEKILEDLNSIYNIRKWLTTTPSQFTTLYISELNNYRKLALFIIILIHNTTLKAYVRN